MISDHGTKAPNQKLTLEIHSIAGPSVEAHYHVHGPETGRNSIGRHKKMVDT